MRHQLRTSIVSLGLVTGALSTAQAAVTYNETVVHDTTTAVEIKLDASTVLCSSADYGALFLKIGMPELARVTLLDHQNIGAGAPCVAAGTCGPGNMPEDIIDPAKPTETVDVNVKAVRLDEVDSTAQTCTTWLIERVRLDVRGVEFTHERSVELGSRPVADCATPAAGAGSGDSKTDVSGSVDPTPQAGGCSATTGGASFPLILALGALVAGRRRRSRR